MCSSRKKPNPPHGRSSEIPGGRGVLKVKILEAKYKAKLEFPGETGVQNRKPSVGGVWIFSETVQYKIKLTYIFPEELFCNKWEREVGLFCKS